MWRDARNIYRKVTRKIYDFSPEQEQNLLAIVWLYRGESGRYLDLVAGYCQHMLAKRASCFTMKDDEGEAIEPLPDFIGALATLHSSVEPFLKTLAKDLPDVEKSEHAGSLLARHKSYVFSLIQKFNQTVVEDGPTDDSGLSLERANRVAGNLFRGGRAGQDRGGFRVCVPSVHNGAVTLLRQHGVVESSKGRYEL